MLSLLFLAAGAIMFALSYFLVRGTSAYTRAGGDAYVRKVRRKMIGLVVLFSAVLLVFIAVGLHEVSTPESLPPPEAISTEPYTPPVLPKPSEDNILTRRETPLHLSEASASGHRRPSDDIPSLSAQALNDPLPSPLPSTTPTPTSTLTGPLADAADAAFSAPLVSPTISPTVSPSPLSTPPATPDVIAPRVSNTVTFDDALAKLNARIKANPNDAEAYGEIGNLYAGRQAWTEAEINYNKSLSIDGSNSSVKYNLAQMAFAQKKYDSARPAFAAMEDDMRVGDIARYKTFLCDLYGGHQEAAAKELDAFNRAGENASYYFANAAWSLYQKKTDDARDWLTSASHIYEQPKIDAYTADLVKLGYLPLPDEPR